MFLGLNLEMILESFNRFKPQNKPQNFLLRFNPKNKLQMSLHSLKSQNKLPNSFDQLYIHLLYIYVT